MRPARKILATPAAGVEFTNGAHDNRVGGTTASAAQRHQRQRQRRRGLLQRHVAVNVLTGNYIGTTAAGSAALAHTRRGRDGDRRRRTNFIGQAAAPGT